MREHTRRHPTESGRWREVSPKIEKPKKIEEEYLSDWREAFSDLFEKYTEAGVALKGFRLRDELTQTQLAEMLGINQANLSNMERGKRPIGKEIAKRLAKIFRTDYRVFL